MRYIFLFIFFIGLYAYNTNAQTKSTNNKKGSDTVIIIPNHQLQDKEKQSIIFQKQKLQHREFMTPLLMTTQKIKKQDG